MAIGTKPQLGERIWRTVSETPDKGLVLTNYEFEQARDGSWVIKAIPDVKQENPDWTVDECFEAVVKDLFGSLVPPKVEPKAEPKVVEPEEITDPHGFLKNGSVIKPTTREGPPKAKGTKAAIEALTPLLMERANNVDTSEHDELPD